jgi:GDP-D-mannose 3', 5'-epimerase
MKRALVTGANGFIGTNLCRRLKQDGYWVKGIDNASWGHDCRGTVDEFESRDLRVPFGFHQDYDEIYQLAANMGGAGFIFSGENDAAVMHDNVLINANVAEAAATAGVGKVFYASSACVYESLPSLDGISHTEMKEFGFLQACRESDAWPANPDSPYGIEKLFSEKLFDSYRRNRDLNVRIGRLHNIFGPNCAWDNGREKAPAAICRKVAEASDDSVIEVWGDGKQTRSFLYIDECLDGIRRLMDSDFHDPINIGSSEMISIEDLVLLVADIAQKRIGISYISGPVGVQGRNSDNTLISEKLGWVPSRPLRYGMERLYQWVEHEVLTARGD